MERLEWSPHDLFQACGEGDPQAWEEFFRRYGTMIRVTALRVIRRFGLQRELDSILNDFLGDLYKRRVAVFSTFEFRWPGAESPYLKVITANGVSSLCRKIVRRTDTEELFDSVPDPAPVSGNGPAMTLDEADGILRKRLDPKRLERDVTIFRLYYRLGHTAGEIAAFRSLGLAESGVESVLADCRKILRSVVKSGRPQQGTGPSPALSKEGERL